MSQGNGDTNSPRSPQDRLAQTAAAVSTSPLVGPHPYALASRKGPSTLHGGLIPRDYLSSLSSSRSPSAQQRTVSDESIPIARRSPATPNESAKRSTGDTAEGQIPLMRHESNDSGVHAQANAEPRPQETNIISRKESYRDQGVKPLSESPKSYATFSANVHPPNDMPRTSSIDSAISNISNPSHPAKAPVEGKDPTREEVRNLIATAGSAENLIQHLLRDKNHAAAQNAQLWKLVDKQRSLLLGLNKDLERLTKERDRYRRKAKDLHAHPSATQVDRLRTEEGYSPQSDGETSTLRESAPTMPSDLKLRQEHQTPSKNIAIDPQIQSSPMDPAMLPPPLHLQQPSKMQSLSTQLAQPSFAVIEATPLSEKPPKSFLASRKAPPKPLDLRPAQDEVSTHQITVPSDVIVSGDEDEEIREPVLRGRRKTREEDDRDREVIALKEQEARSRSKKEKKAKPEDEESSALGQLPLPPTAPSEPTQAFSPLQDHLSPMSVASGSVGSSVALSLPLRSPGLPMSPRPLMGSALPMSPRVVPGGNFPLSPRAPKMPLPTPMTPGTQAPAPQHLAQAALTESQKKPGPSSLAKMNTTANTESDRGPTHESPMSPAEVPAVNRRLVDPSWPDLLLPPNALPSIQVKVASSRLRPSRNSMLGLRTQEENAVFTLSIFERATSSELWRLEKYPTSLANLDQQLRPRCADLPKLPDRRLFSGHSPAMTDARRDSINGYFDDLLDTPMDEKAAANICRFLSTDVMEPQLVLPTQIREEVQSKPIQEAQSGIPTKSGYLTKKGKNFGGWKSRYFVLDSQDLRYFEAPGGAHLGTIKLLNARIGRQTQSDPAAHPEVDSENQYRHAFLILEPKRKDSNSHVRHVLCAESDAERDEWVETLLHYIDEKPVEAKSQYGAGIPTPQAKDARNPQRSGQDDAESKFNESPQTHMDTPSPSNASSHTPELVHEALAASKPFNISGPINGSVISDAGSWGNKSTGTSASKEREQKKRNLFHFRKPSYEQLAPVQPTQPKRSELNAHRGGHVRPVFGMQLQEAVEYYSPTDVDIYLPAVVYRCIEFLRAKHATNEEGLFRLSGSNIVIRLLKDRFNTEGDVDLLAEDEDYDVNAVASLLKTYLRELPSTILTRELHLEFLKGLELPDKPQKIAAFNALVHQLPSANFSLLRTLSQYLLEVVQNAERNKMTIKNVGIVFSPTLNIPAPLFAMFLTDFDAIFDKPVERESVRSLEIERDDGTLTPEDIRSPRRQMFTDLPTPMYNQDSFAQNARVAVAPKTTSRPGEYQPDPANDFGFAPIQSSYEARQYVSIPHELPMAAPRYPPPQPPQQQGGNNLYGGRNNMMAPDNPATEKARRRESSMLFL
ncbi:Rho GTPase activating protein [Cladophialophora chaetospira]|uniref:Rho GTPase activating protein n=1 Tax=Cladophialophora chaetospira TaxID=386627 RepID=A0AA38X3Z7_9EURO|nr:Rho GTPase activating protein [Cladophialophora chaetospira]